MFVPQQIFSIASIAGSTPTRYSSNKVCFVRDAQSVVAVATNGHMLIHASWIETCLPTLRVLDVTLPAGDLAYLSRDACLAIRDAMPLHGMAFIDRSGDVEIFEEFRSTVISEDSNKFEFPDWCTLIASRHSPVVEFTVSKEMLRQLIDAIDDVCDSKHVRVIVPASKSLPMRIECDGDVKVTALLMQVNTDAITTIPT